MAAVTFLVIVSPVRSAGSVLDCSSEVDVHASRAGRSRPDRCRPARRRWPGCTSPAGSRAPARASTPKACTLLASQATAVTGLPSTAPAAPCAISVPFCAGSPRCRRCPGPKRAVARPPSTTRADEALSAMVSSSVIFQSRIRQSMISRTGTTKSVARSTSATLTPGPSRRRPRTKATSTSTRGWHRMAGVDGVLLEDEHVVEQVAVVRLVDAHHLLHGPGRQAHLVAR